MSAFFGINGQGSGDFLERGSVCLDETRECALLNTFHSIRADDIVFIKRFSQQMGIEVNAVGVVLPGCATMQDNRICLPVEWCWQGEKHIEIMDEEYIHCEDGLYEEHNIWIQSGIIALLPGKFQLPKEW